MAFGAVGEGGDRDPRLSGRAGGGFSMPIIGSFRVSNGVKLGIALALVLVGCEMDTRTGTADVVHPPAAGADAGPKMPKFGELQVSANTEGISIRGSSAYPFPVRMFVEVVDDAGALIETPNEDDTPLEDGFLIDPGSFELEVPFSKASPGDRALVLDEDGEGREYDLDKPPHDIPEFPAKGSN